MTMSYLLLKNKRWFRKTTIHIADRTFIVPARAERYVGPFPRGTRWRTDGPLVIERIRPGELA